MFILFEINDNKNTARGKVLLCLNFDAKIWAIDDDPLMLWRNICTVQQGSFERKPDGQIAFTGKNPSVFLTMDKAPSSETDLATKDGSGNTTKAVNQPAFRETTFKWSIDLNASKAPPKVAQPALSAFRRHLLKRLNELFPAPYLSANCDILTSKLRKTDAAVAATPHYTTCGSLPGFVTAEMARWKGVKDIKALNDYVNKYSLNGTFAVRTKGMKYNCWTESNALILPQPGDIYALLTSGAKDKKLSGISHVGVVEDPSGDFWKTFDLGQYGGFDGDKVVRHYKPLSCELFGESNQGGGYRVIAGWVDVDKYCETTFKEYNDANDPYA